MKYYHPFQTCVRLTEELRKIRGPTKALRELADKLAVASYLAREDIPFVTNGGQSRFRIELADKES